VTSSIKDNKNIKERSYEFAIKIIKLSKKLPKDTGGFVLGRQLIKSGTSIGANVEEATGAFSGKKSGVENFLTYNL